jgi:ubiquinone/menaquinone biosynthesis C-methylase UbiE
MDIDVLLHEIVPSHSDRILQENGFDLVREYFDLAHHLSPVRSPVIELATGTGRMIAVLSSLSIPVITGDISLTDQPRALARVPEQFQHHVRFLQLDMEHLPFRSDSLPAIVCLNTLHETEHPHDCLQEMIRSIHPSGELLVGDFNRTGYDMMQIVQRTVYHNDHSEGNITSDEIAEELRRKFDSVHTIATPLNTTFLASGKR